MGRDGNGRIRGLRARLIADLGAYLQPLTPVPPVTAAMLLTGVYAIPAAEVELLGVATTKVPTGPYGGAGRPEAAYIVERMVDLAARDLGMDPVDLRRRNLIAPDRFPYDNLLGYVYDSGDYGRALERACALIAYERQREEQRLARQEGRLVGIGVSVYVERAGERLSAHPPGGVGAGGGGMRPPASPRTGAYRGSPPPARSTYTATPMPTRRPSWRASRCSSRCRSYAMRAHARSNARP